VCVCAATVVYQQRSHSQPQTVVVVTSGTIVIALEL